MMHAALTSAIERWLADDPDELTRRELETLADRGRAGDAGAIAELTARFAGRLAFGTAGLRAELGAGPMRMNRVVVAQAAGGLARYLLEREDAPSVVIGFDGRHGSEVFARDTATIMAGAGVRTILLPAMSPTPVLAFAVRHLAVSAGVMVTASHNPPRDNGVKVYLGGTDGGAQIVPPADAAIAAKIAEVASRPIAELPRSTDFTVADREVVRAYVAATAAVVPGTAAEPVMPGAAAALLRIVYTAMHGVGTETLLTTFAAAGLPEPLLVTEQAEPDADFPTVAFPNPEEPGALDLAFATAREAGADLILANDPDADRLAVAIPDPAADGGWRRLSGNELGLLLGWAAAEQHAAGRSAGDVAHDPAGGTLANSLVSSPALGWIAARFGLRHVETLTGFKWISRTPGLVYGFEEALGYLVDPAKVHDKDGISAAVRFADLASRWRAAGRTVDDMLDLIAAEVGASVSGQVSIRVTDLAEIGRLTDGLRAAPPTMIAGRTVEAADDFLTGVGGFAAADILRYRLEDGSRVIVRPSGTEPKLKVYLDAAWHEGTGRQRRERAAAAVAELDTAMRELLGL